LDFIFECNLIGLSLYSIIININLNGSYYFVSIEEMIIDFPVKKKIAYFQAKNVIKGIFTYMEYFYRKDKYKRSHKKLLKTLSV
jgi:hypothetical protein